MFIATMYSYGSDTDAVGVDGIRGCIGIFLATANRLYAIHIPDMPNQFNAGRQAFVAYVNLTEPLFDRATARLYAVVNGTNRDGVYRELLDYAHALGGVRKFMTVRVNEFLGPKGHQQDSAAIILERLPYGAGCILKYKRAEDVAWTHNVGTARAGFYFNGALDAVRSTNPALGQGWHLVEPSNSTIATTNW